MIDFGALANATNQALFGTTNLIQSQVNANRANRQQILNLQTQAMLNEMSANAADRRTRMLWQDLQSPSAMVRQYKEAGLNPALMYAQSGAGGSLMAGAQSHGVGLPNAIMAENVPILNAEAANMAAEYNKTMAEIANIKADTSVKEKDLPLKDQMLDNLKQEVAESKQRIAVMGQDIQKKFAETMNEYQKHNNLKAEEELTKAKADYENSMTTLTNIQISFEPERIKSQIKEMNAKAAEAYAAAKKFNAEAETENQCRQYIKKQIQYAAEEQAYKTLYLQPEEYRALKADIESVILANDKEKGVLEAYGKWKRKANHDRILEILNFCASASKAEAANKVGSASLINAAGTAVKAVPK